MEPMPDKLVASKKLAKRDDTMWKDIGDHIELFYNYPRHGRKILPPLHQSYGQIIDALNISAGTRDSTFKTKAEFATKILKDRWVLEIRIPCSEIGMNCYDGATWKLNIARSRKVDGQEHEMTSCASGYFHGAGYFVNTTFSPSRRSGLAGISKGAGASWQNGGFDIAEKNSTQRLPWQSCIDKEADLKPTAWSVSGPNAIGEYRLHQNSDSKPLHALGKTATSHSTSSHPLQEKFACRSAHAVQGNLSVWTMSYESYPPEKNILGYKQHQETSKSDALPLDPGMADLHHRTHKTGPAHRTRRHPLQR